MAVTSTKNHRPVVFEYLDYRIFLRDFINFHKKHVRGFTHRTLAQKAGVSAGILSDILSGRQNLTLPVAQRYAKAFELRERERQYLSCLILFNNASTNDEKNSRYAELTKARGRSSAVFLDTKQYEYFSRWYHAVVRELIHGKSVDTDPALIAGKIQPQISAAQVKKAIRLLESLGLIEQCGGRWQQTSTVVSSEFQIQSVALKNYQSEMIRLAQESIERYPSDSRELQALTLRATPEFFRKLKERIRLFTDEVLSMAATEENGEEMVLQFNMQLFPFTKAKEGEHDHASE
jgi:uncharacterized protein (TIGR02147 family)